MADLSVGERRARLEPVSCGSTESGIVSVRAPTQLTGCAVRACFRPLLPDGPGIACQLRNTLPHGMRLLSGSSVDGCDRLCTKKLSRMNNLRVSGNLRCLGDWLFERGS